MADGSMGSEFARWTALTDAYARQIQQVLVARTGDQQQLTELAQDVQVTGEQFANGAPRAPRRKP